MSKTVICSEAELNKALNRYEIYVERAEYSLKKSQAYAMKINMGVGTKADRASQKKYLKRYKEYMTLANSLLCECQKYKMLINSGYDFSRELADRKKRAAKKASSRRP